MAASPNGRSTRAARPGRHAESGARDRWVVAYADFVTLLFAFFTSMYAASNVDVSKLNSVVESMKKAFVRGEAVGPPSTGIRPAQEPTIASASAGDPRERDLQQKLRERLAEQL